MLTHGLYIDGMMRNNFLRSLALTSCCVCFALVAGLGAWQAHAQGGDTQAQATTQATQPADATTQTLPDTTAPTGQLAPQAPATADTPSPPASGDTGGTTPLFEQSFLEALHTIWQLTLFTAGSTDIKLNQLVIALFVVLIGLFIAKRITKVISGRLVKVSKVSDTVAETLGKIIYYIASAVVILIAMQVAGIPTTIFTVLGGALAIGVGFGAQNLFNNLISGIIILTEKPIRRRDIIEIDGMEGQVAEIGNRRTRVRMGNGIDVLVPNSTFLETNVINWTLQDSKIRGHVNVGVAYGSPVKQVRDLLLKAATEHERTNKLPAPVVLFTEFADNTLNFTVYFWTEVSKPMDLRLIESDLRFVIDELFHEAKITIAFPQRDVHLDTLRPLEVRMVSERQPDAESGA